jgi:TPP-dependent pyruvate/acetoin dehydrogenase alpha subunit
MQTDGLARTGQMRDLLDSLYRTMVTIRAFEQRAGRLFAAGELPGFLHLSIGQEAVAAGVCSALRRSDVVTTTHRGHGHCLAKGADPFRMFAEMYGRREGYGKGRSGSMHVADPETGVLGANAIVCAGLPIALGAAVTSQTTGADDVAVAFIGDGAVAAGPFHESLNIAALWSLPLVIVCENNGYAEMTPTSTHLAVQRVSDLAAAYGIPGVLVDGNDALAVREATVAALARARASQGPTLLECATHRVNGHFEGDPQRYKDPLERERWSKRDPIDRFRAILLESDDVTPGALERLDAEIEEQIRLAADAAKDLPLAGLDVIVEDVWSGGGADS